VDTIDVAVWGKVAEVLRDPKLLAFACALGVEEPAVDWAAQVESARRKLGELEKLEGDVLRRQRHGLLSSAAGDRELGEIAGERRLAARNLQLAEHQLGGGAASRPSGVKDSEVRRWPPVSTRRRSRSVARWSWHSCRRSMGAS
jgi:hypothetical protein